MITTDGTYLYASNPEELAGYPDLEAHDDRFRAKLINPWDVEAELLKIGTENNDLAADNYRLHSRVGELEGEVEVLRKGLTDIRDSTFRSAVVLRGMAGNTLTHPAPSQVLDEPAKVGAVEFGKGVAWASVIACAQRAYKHPAPSQADGDGWKRMTEEARRIQMRHLDKHEGDVYHAMQSLCVKFGSRREDPMTEDIPAITPQAVATAGDGVTDEQIDRYIAAHEKARIAYTETTVAPIMETAIREGIRAGLSEFRRAGGAP